jgi:hypothetical protein
MASDSGGRKLSAMAGERKHQNPNFWSRLRQSVAKPRPDSLDLTPETVTNRAGRDPEQLSNFLSFEFGSPQRKNGSVSLAELSNDLFEIQARVYLADPSIVCRVL